jgi:hypothetical protein
MMPSFLAGSDLGFHNRFLKFLCFAIPRTQTAIKQSSPHRVEFESTESHLGKLLLKDRR